MTVKFTDQSSGTPTSWNWEISNGTLSDAKNPTVSFSTPGTYSVKLVVRNADGIDEIEKIDYITVFPTPTANFSADITLGCVPVKVNFTDLSATTVGTIVSWSWDFGDGNTSTQKNPSHSYTSTGFYTVTLIVTSSTGCKRTVSKTRFIRVVDGVSTDFNFTVSRSCKAPFAVTFRNQSSGPGTISYTWNFGNGQTSTAQNPSTVYNAPGTYTIRLNAQSNFGCSGSVQKQITLTETNTDFISPTNICLGLPVSFQNNSSAPPDASFWNFADGTTSAQVNPVKTFLTAGTYNVKMINFFNSCVDSISKTVVVEDKPAVNFTVNDSSSCQAPFNVQFTDLTPGATSWQWDFGDGNTSTQQNPSHQYTQIGNYTVKLIANTSLGCGDSIIKTDLIKIQETEVQITGGGGCIPFTYRPQATIQTIDTIASYLWDFGDGTTSTQPNPAHTYTSEGTYNISLTITTVGGCTKTVTLPDGVRTGTPPTVDFSAAPLNACASDKISFTGQAVTTPGASVGWFWNFGDGKTGTGPNPTHIFDAIGNVNVILTVINNGCEASTTKVLQVKPPIAKFTHKVNCINRRDVTFTNTSLVDPAITPLTYLWEMGDPANTKYTTATPPVFSYPAPGTYNVKLTVTNGLCSFTETNPVIITDEFADFSIDKNPVCKNETFNLSAINSNAGRINRYSWKIGTYIPDSTTRTINHSLPDAGDYDVSLTVRDINGCTHTKTVADYIKVNGSVAKFAPASGGCLNKAVTFNDSSTTSSSIVNWEWNFGDGAPQSFTAPPFTHTYSKEGRYKVTLKVTDAAGCTDQSLPIDLRVTNPLAGFRADTFYCPGAPLPFVDTSSGAGLSFHWDFGDGGTSITQHPRHNYPVGDASYTVKLKIRDVSGCEDSITKVDYIKIRSPKAAFDIQDTTTICPPLRTSFTFKGTDYKSFYWDFGDGGTSTLQTPSHFYSDYGRFIPKLYVLGPGGCIDSAEASVSVVNPLAAAKINYVLPAGPICNSVTVDFTLVVPPAFKFAFFFGDGAVDSSQQKTLSHFYSRPSLNTPRLVIYDTISGCEVSINGTPRINVLGAIPLFSKDKKEFCDQGVVTFNGKFTTKNEPIISNIWNFGDGSPEVDAVNPSHTFTQPGTYIVTLTVTTRSNCSKSSSDTVRVYRTPSPSIQGRDTICMNIAEPFGGTLATADTLTNWQWNFGNGQTSSEQNNAVTFTTPGDYAIQLTTTNKIGCSGDTTKNVHVTPLPTATPAQDPLTIAVGIGANILMNYTGDITSYNWIPTTRLSCTDCPTPFANPQYTTKYTVQVEDRFGCKNSGDITVIVVCGKENFFVPNTFSPNGDGRNEVFYPKGRGLFRIKSMRIFNRWGEVVFEKKEFAANDPSAGWNGTYKGKPASPDAYIYTMEILCENNAVIPVKGNVTLLR